MKWMHFAGDYKEAHFGASGGTKDPAVYPQTEGASHATADEISGAKRNAYSLDPRGGMAASVKGPAGTVVGVKPHITAMDGFMYSEISQHPNGLFGQNTAVTSPDSEQANYEHYLRDKLKFGTRTKSGYLILPEGPTATSTGLVKQRGTRLDNEEDALVVKDKPYQRNTHLFQSGPKVTVESAGLVGLLLYAAYRLVFP